MSSKLDIYPNRQGSVSILKLDGMLDGHTAPDLEHYLKQQIEDQQVCLVLDLQGLTYIASAGVGIMINVLQQVQNLGGCLHIARPTSTVREIFNLLGLEALLSIHANLDDAVIAASA